MAAGPLSMPRNLIEAADLEGRGAWLETLPTTVHALELQWALTVGMPFQPGGSTAWVAPVRNDRGFELVLKVGWRHSEARHEAEGLRVWGGDGTVQLHAALDLGDETTALLLERCLPGTDLAGQPEPDQDVVIAGLLRRLWRHAPAGHDFRPLQVMCDEWADSFAEKVAAGRGSLDPGIAREGIHLFRALPATAERRVLLCTDLHAGNVLAAEREPWLAVDPKPYLGDPTYDALQHMLNCPERLRADPVELASRMADLLELDVDRLLLWLFARCVQESPDYPNLADVARLVAPT
jgi:streptomycin 6-kinase